MTGCTDKNLTNYANNRQNNGNNWPNSQFRRRPGPTGSTQGLCGTRGYDRPVIQLSRAATWALLLGVAVGPSVVAMTLWSPFLLSSRLRSLFRAVPPTESMVVGYALVAVGLWVPYLAGLGWVLVRTTGTTGATTANGLLDVVVPVSLLYLVGLPAGAVLGLPRAGVDWDPTGYGAATWALLVAGAAWWAVLLGGPVFLLSLVMALPT